MGGRTEVAEVAALMSIRDDVHRAIRHLDASLHDGETARCVVGGTYGPGRGLLAVTTQRVLLLGDQGSEAFALERLKVAEYSTEDGRSGTFTVGDHRETAVVRDVSAADGAQVGELLRSLNVAVARSPRRRWSAAQLAALGRANVAAHPFVGKAESPAADLDAAPSGGTGAHRLGNRGSGRSRSSADRSIPSPLVPAPPARAFDNAPETQTGRGLADRPVRRGNAVGESADTTTLPRVLPEAVPDVVPERAPAPEPVQVTPPTPAEVAQTTAAVTESGGQVIVRLPPVVAGSERNARHRRMEEQDAAPGTRSGTDADGSGQAPIADGIRTDRAIRRPEEKPPTRRRRVWLAAAVAVPVIGLAALGTVKLTRAPDAGVYPAPVALDLRVGPTARVVNVLDGGTVELSGAYGGKVTVAGIAAPKVTRGECGANASTGFATRTLKGMMVTLIMDPTQLPTNTAGVRQADLRLPDGSYYSVVAVRAGMAHYYQGVPPAQNSGQIEAAEAQAQKDGVGLWGAPCNSQ